MSPLTEAEAAELLATIEREGYVVIPGVIPPEQFDCLDEVVSQVAAEYQRVVTAGELFRSGGTISGHLNCHPGVESKRVYDILREQGVLEIVRLHDPAVIDQVRVTMNFNLPHSHDQHFHSDGLYVENFLAINIALVDVTLDNGPTDVIPKSHLQFHKFWEYARPPDVRQAVPVCMKKGDVLVRFSTMWHRGTANKSDLVRPMMSLTFGEKSAPASNAFDSEILFLPNWYGTTRADEVRERVFVGLPFVYSTVRFGRSLVGNKGYASGRRGRCGDGDRAIRTIQADGLTSLSEPRCRPGGAPTIGTSLSG